MSVILLFFEVLDKEPPIGEIWQWFLILAGIGFVLAFIHRYLVVLAVVVAGLVCAFNLTEFWDPNINASIWNEDSSYLPQVYLAMAISIMAPLLGAGLNILLFKRKPR